MQSVQVKGKCVSETTSHLSVRVYLYTSVVYIYQYMRCVCVCESMNMPPRILELPEQEGKREDEPHSQFLPQRQSHQRKCPRGKKLIIVGASYLLLYLSFVSSETFERTLVSPLCLESRNA